MKKYLLPQYKQCKANLHTHSNLSDGAHSPEELKQLYMERGYSIVAYTDHEIIWDQSHLCDESFVAINGYEYAITSREGEVYNDKATCHLNLWAKDQKNLSHVCYSPEYRRPKKVTEEEARALPHYGEYVITNYSVESINHVIEEANKHGYMVCYNHPYWSMEGFNTFSQYKGYQAVEVFNRCSGGSGYYEFTPYIYDELLRMGKKVLPIAADDTHRIWKDVKYHKQAFGGFNMMAAKELSYESIIEAMEKGDMYASTGATIDEIYVEDNTLTLNFEPCEVAYFRTHNRRGSIVFNEQAEPITTASFKLAPEDKYVFAYIKTFDGRWAVTRAYYADELFD